MITSRIFKFYLFEAIYVALTLKNTSDVRLQTRGRNIATALPTPGRIPNPSQHIGNLISHDCLVSPTNYSWSRQQSHPQELAVENKGGTTQTYVKTHVVGRITYNDFEVAL